MKRILSLPAAGVLVATVATVAGPALSAANHRFVAHLSGDEEVPPVETNATGQTIFRLNADGDAIEYKLIVANLENVTAAHIHLAPAGENGPVIAWLYPEGPPAEPIDGRFSGVLSVGAITAGDLVGPMVGATFEEFLEAIRDGNTYVNVHTGEYPAGEIRGQIR